jgi:hypothetical protein
VNPRNEPKTEDPSARTTLLVILFATVVVLATRLPFARTHAVDFDEEGYLIALEGVGFPMHHTLFLAAGKLLGTPLGGTYRGLVAVSMATSVLALIAAWWWLRALVTPRTSLAIAAVLAVGPVFWSYGAMAANYTAIIAVGSFLLGIAWRGRSAKRSWHPYAAAVALAVGTGYRQDIGVYWAPVFLVILWQHRWIPALQAGLLSIVLALLWLVPMLRDAGGWEPFRQQSAEFSYNAGYLNSIWVLGPIDATVRYLLKLAMAVLGTLGLLLVFVPRGVMRLGRRKGGLALGLLLALSTLPSLTSHLLVHFGVPGYAFHDIPALLALAAIGLPQRLSAKELVSNSTSQASLAWRTILCGGLSAAFFLFYPTNFQAQGFKGDFDLAFARLTRAGLAVPNPVRDPKAWRTINSQELPGDSGRRATSRRESLEDLFRIR